MIFVTLGSQRFPFNRLLKAVDQLIEDGEIQEPVFAQIGYSDYRPIHYSWEEFIPRGEFGQWEERADIVITHGGTGSIIEAVKKCGKVIAVPRLQRYGEHVDDHQIQLINEFRNKNLICGLDDCSGLGNAIRYVRKHKFATYQGNTQDIIDSLDAFIQTEVVPRVK